MYQLGKPVTVVVDDYLPVRTNANGVKETLFAGVEDGKPLWPALFEKAYAKISGNYKHLEWGFNGYALHRMSGGPINYSYVPSLTTDELWDQLLSYTNRDDIVSLLSKAAPEGVTDVWHTSPNGITVNHAYSALRVKELSDKTRLVLVRNPFAWEKYTGPWSDSSDKWTDAFRKEVGGHTSANDGSFWMDIDTVAKEFEYTGLNVVETAGLQQAEIVVIDDDTPDMGKAGCAYCVEHEFTIDSPVDQTVHVFFHTWSWRMNGNKCDTADKRKIEISKNGTFVQSKKYEGIDFANEQVKAGESLTYKFLFDYSQGEYPRDWSFAVQSKTAVTLTSDKGLTSDPLIAAV